MFIDLQQIEQFWPTPSALLFLNAHSKRIPNQLTDLGKWAQHITWACEKIGYPKTHWLIHCPIEVVSLGYTHFQHQQFDPGPVLLGSQSPGHAASSSAFSLRWNLLVFNSSQGTSRLRKTTIQHIFNHHNNNNHNTNIYIYINHVLKLPKRHWDYFPRKLFHHHGNRQVFLCRFTSP